MFNRAGEGLLSSILRIVGVLKDAQRQPVNLSLMPRQQFLNAAKSPASAARTRLASGSASDFILNSPRMMTKRVRFGVNVLQSREARLAIEFAFTDTNSIATMGF